MGTLIAIAVTQAALAHFGAIGWDTAFGVTIAFGGGALLAHISE